MGMAVPDFAPMRCRLMLCGVVCSGMFAWFAKLSSLKTCRCRWRQRPSRKRSSGLLGPAEFDFPFWKKSQMGGSRLLTTVLETLVADHSSCCAVWKCAHAVSADIDEPASCRNLGISTRAIRQLAFDATRLKAAFNLCCRTPVRHVAPVVPLV